LSSECRRERFVEVPAQVDGPGEAVTEAGGPSGAQSCTGRALRRERCRTLSPSVPWGCQGGTLPHGDSAGVSGRSRGLSLMVRGKTGTRGRPTTAAQSHMLVGPQTLRAAQVPECPRLETPAPKLPASPSPAFASWALGTCWH